MTALEGAMLELRDGTVHALLGENGAGKTTLMRIAFGMLAPDAGTMRRGGELLQLRSPADAIRARIGMVHQHYTLVPAMTVAENLALGGGAIPGLRFDRARAAQRVRELAGEAGLPIDPESRVESLSVSAQQRVEILKALARDARLLILDEPTAVLAPAESEELLAWLRRYVARGNAAVLITHKLHEALAVADDVTVLRHGRTVLSAAARTLTVAQVTSAMLGEHAREVARSSSLAGAPAGDVIARLEGVCARSPDERQRLADASMEIRAGEVTGIAAVEGSGQHALLRVLAGRLAPASGRATLPSGIGFIPEDRHRDAIAVDMTLTENVALRGAGTRRGIMRWRRLRSHAASLILSHDVRAEGTEALARALSGGNQQKLVVARELDGDPVLVVAENPTRGLDVRATESVHDRLRAAAARGAAVVLYSTDLDEVLDLSSRLFVVFGGRVREVPVDRTAAGRAMLGEER